MHLVDNSKVTDRRNMDKDLKNKTVVVTGGANGIGYNITEAYLKEGVKTVIILDLNENDGRKAVENLNAKYGNKTVFYRCDVAKDLKEITKKITKEFKSVDVLINNAGILNENNVKATINVNVTSVIEWSLEFLELMRKDKGGKGGTIINIASICGYRVYPFVPVYQASKFAVLGFSKCLGHEYNYSRTGVRVAALCPGFTRTTLGSGIQPIENDEAMLTEFKKFLEGQIWQEVETVGKAAVDVFFKATPGSAWLIEGGKSIEEV